MNDGMRCYFYYIAMSCTRGGQSHTQGVALPSFAVSPLGMLRGHGMSTRGEPTWVP